MKYLLTEKQLIKLVSNIKKIITDEKVKPKDFILINKNRNGIR